MLQGNGNSQQLTEVQATLDTLAGLVSMPHRPTLRRVLRNRYYYSTYKADRGIAQTHVLGRYQHHLPHRSDVVNVTVSFDLRVTVTK